MVEESITMEPWRVTKNVIGRIVRGDYQEGDWNFFGVYGPPYAQEHQSFWDSMIDSTSRGGRSWVLVGDLNQIISAGEKSGRC